MGKCIIMLKLNWCLVGIEMGIKQRTTEPKGLNAILVLGLQCRFVGIFFYFSLVQL